MRILFISFFILISFCPNLNAQWQVLDTGLTDDLISVLVSDDRYLLLSKENIYKSTDGIVWSKIVPASSIEEKYTNAIFSDMSVDPELFMTEGTVYIGGQYQNSSAILLSYDFVNDNLELLYEGDANTSINQIKYTARDNRFIAVGDNGFFLEMVDGVVKPQNTELKDDFLSVDHYNSVIRVGTKDHLLGGRLRNNTPLELDTLNLSSGFHADIYMIPNSTIHSVGDGYYGYFNNGIQPITDYDFGMLNGHVIWQQSNLHLVGTDHGIFISDRDKKFLERFSSTENFSINDITTDLSVSEKVYACGDNGVLLVTENLGGPATPYIKIEGRGTCVNFTNRFELTKGTGQLCRWFIDGVLVSNDCRDFENRFTEVGMHVIRCESENSVGEVTAKEIEIYTVEKPLRDIELEILDSILCKSEPINITLSPAEKNVQYQLISRDTRNSFGQSDVGQDADLEFVSDSVSLAGLYYFKAVHSLADCEETIAGDFQIDVEYTQADFTTSLINAKRDEEVVLTQKSIDADKFLWTFHGSSDLASSQSTQQTVSYSSLGSTSITLRCESPHACVDEVTKEGPFIYEVDLSTPTCRSLIHNGVDDFVAQYGTNAYPGFSDAEVLDMKTVSDGFISCGYFNQQVFDSKHGVTYSSEAQAGSYLCKHDYDGTLKWMVNSEKFRDSQRDVIISMALDSEENIYLAGFSSGDYYGNHGEYIDFYKRGNEQGFFSGESYILKLDSNGKLIWYMDCGNFHPSRLICDLDDNLVVAGNKRLDGLPKIIYLNDELSDTLFSDTRGQVSKGLVKFNSKGRRVWDTELEAEYIYDLGVDGNNNIYLGGNMDGEADFYSVGQASPETVSFELLGFGKRMVIAKYNAEGRYIWGIFSETKRATTSGSAATTMYSMSVTLDGDIYATGINKSFVAEHTHVYYNADGSTTEESVGSGYFCKVNSEGVCEWIRGAQYSDQGRTYKSLVNDQGDICFIGRIEDLNFTQDTAEFISTNGKSCFVPINESNYHVAFYDELGNVKRVVVNGDNSEDIIGGKRISGFQQGADGNYYVAQNMNYFIGASGYETFGHLIDSLDGVDAVITSFETKCGIGYYPEGTPDEDGDGWNMYEDCDDQDPNVNPGATEIEGNGVDEDCDGSDISTSISEIETVNKVVVYPIPSDGKIKLKNVSTAVRCKVYNLKGQLVFESEGMTELDLSFLDASMYLLEIILKESKEYHKLIIND